MALTLIARHSGLFFSWICAVAFSLLCFLPAPAEARGAKPTPQLRIYVQARCHDSGFRLIPAEIALSISAQTPSLKITRFVARIPKGTTDIRLTAPDSVDLAGGTHCVFHHWTWHLGRSPRASRISTSNTLVIDKLRHQVVATAAYFNCADPSNFPQCPNSMSAVLSRDRDSAKSQPMIPVRILQELELPPAAAVRIQLFDATGRLLYQRLATELPDPLPLADVSALLANGLYLYTITVRDPHGRVLVHRIEKFFWLR
jgi:hypothetical protein